MITNIEREVRKIARHLDVVLTDEQYSTILPTMSFEHMKANQSKFQPISVKWKPGFDFIRKGIVGDGQTLFGPEEEQIFEQMVGSLCPDGAPSWLAGLI